MNKFKIKSSYAYYFSNTTLITVLDCIDDHYLVFWPKLGRKETISLEMMEYYAKHECIENLKPILFDQSIIKNKQALLDDVNFFFRDEDAFTWEELLVVLNENNYHNDFYHFFNNNLKTDMFSVVETLTAHCSRKYYKDISVV